jgi:hypothetical protein
MNSLRERIARAVVDRLRAAVSVPVLRQPTTAQPRDVGPFVAVVMQSDSGEAINTVLHRTLTLRITAVSRDSADPWGQADALLCAAHSALLSDPTLGGLALQVALQDTDFEAEDADAAAVAIPAVYAITYRTARADITQGA